MAQKSYTADEIVTAVKIILDENRSSSQLTGIPDEDQLQTDEIIRNLIPHALNRLADLAPEEYLADLAVTVSDSASALTDISSKKYGRYMAAPSDMLRILSVYCSDWEQPVREFLSGTDDEYIMQRSPYAGIRGSVYNPVAALVNNPVGSGLRIEVYTTGQDRATVVYIPDFTSYTAEAESYSLTGRIYTALLYMIADLYYITIDEKERASMMESVVAEQLHAQKTESDNNG